ncbi:MAG TPA: FecR domain-containing protein [Aliidongia sp.]|nr:FecR domain-containing protein [Aliidongia sp.]
MMNGPDRRRDHLDSLLREAQGWVVRLHSGTVSQAEIEALESWRGESPAHRRAFAEANLRWDVLRLAAQGFVAKHGRDGAHDPQLFGRRALLGGLLAAAGTGGFYLAVRPPLSLWPSISELAADYRTETGEQRQLTLTDGVAVQMNTQTSLSLRGSVGDAPRLELIAGEVSVATKGALAEPLIVTAGVGKVSALDAGFDLRLTEVRALVTCLRGEVQVQCGQDRATLQPGQQIAYNRRGLSSAVAVDGELVEAWRRGLLVFDETPLAQVVEEVNRYRAGKIILLDAELGRLPLDATFRLDRIEEALPKIAHVFNAKVQLLPGGVVLLG